MIELFLSPGSRTKAAFHEAVSSDLLEHIQVTEAHRDTKPRHGHMVLVPPPVAKQSGSGDTSRSRVSTAGEGSPSKQVEAFAARIGAYCVCIPEAGEWLTKQIRQRLELQLPLVMVDAALAGTNQYSKAK